MSLALFLSALNQSSFGWSPIVSSSNVYAHALAAATDAASAQHYPQGALYVVATPIGNLADISLRALHVLNLAETIACEDTRHSQAMLRAYGIDKTAVQLLAVHQHNEAEASEKVIERLRNGQRVAYVSDAGTPGVSDPGARLVTAVRTHGLRAIPLPGASSVTALLCVAGSPSEGLAEQGFLFGGFFPAKATAKAEFWSLLLVERRCVVLLEAPHRIEATALLLSKLEDRMVTVGRELTKQFEEIATMPVQDFPAWLKASPTRLKGEFALAVHPARMAPEPAQNHKVLKLLLAELPLKTAVRLAAEITGEAKNSVYEAALALKTSSC
jgi:16S rRNA (cytidine1402-2'-O)-methyltransferase